MCKWLFHHNKGTQGIGIRSRKQNKGPCWDNINCHFRSEVEKMLLVWPMNWLNTPKDQSLLEMLVHQWGWWNSLWTFWMLSFRSYGPVKKTLLEGVITRYTPPITSSCWDNNCSWIWYFFLSETLIYTLFLHVYSSGISIWEKTAVNTQQKVVITFFRE